MGDISKKQRLSAEGKKETPPKVTHEKRMTDQSMMPYEKKRFGLLVALGFDVAVFTPAPYRRPRLGRP